jgi:TP901 family phage tail tape measure protein
MLTIMAGDKIQILIQAILEKTSKASLEQELKQIENKLKPVKVSVDTDAEAQVKLYKSLEKIYKLEEDAKIKQEKNSAKALADREKQLQYEQKVRQAIEKNVQQQQEETVQLEKQIALFQRKMQIESQRIVGKYGTLVNTDSMQNLQQELSGLNTTTPDVTNKMKTMSLGMKQIEVEAKNSSKALKLAQQDADSFGSAMSKNFYKFGLWFGIGSVFMSVVHSATDAINTVNKLDESITNLKKVSDELGNSVSIKDFLGDVNQLAIEVGHSTQAAIDSVTDFKKLGYSLQEASTLAKQALVYSNISDQPIEDATKSIISTLKGFQLGVQDVNHVMDSYNEVGNRFSITSAGIGSALQRSSSALYEAGNTLEQSIGLITAANASIQNPEKVGNGLKTVAMRIRGIADESGEAYPQLDKLIKTITGVDIMKDDNTFKSTYDVMVEISNVWKDLTDKDRATLQEAMFGKQQGAVGASLLNNMQDGIKANETAINSLGSSAREQAAYMDSIKAKVNTLKETVVGFWSKSIDSSFIKGFVEALTELVKAFDNLSNVMLIAGTALLVWKGAAITTAVKGLKDFSLATKLAASDITLFNNLGFVMQARAAGAATTIEALSFSFKALGASIKASFLSNPIGWIALIATAAYEVYNAVNISAEEAKQKIEELNQEISSIQQKKNSLDSLSEEYINLTSKVTLSADEHKKLLDIQNDIAGISKELIFGYDAEGNAILKGTDAINDQSKAYERLIALKIQERDEVLKDTIKGAVRDTTKANANFSAGFSSESSLPEDVKRRYPEINALKNSYLEAVSNQDYKSAAMYLQKIQSISGELAEQVVKIKDARDQIRTSLDQITQGTPEFLQLPDSLQKIILDYNNVLAGSVQTGKITIDDFKKQQLNLVNILSSESVRNAFEQFQQKQKQLQEGTSTESDVQAAKDAYINELEQASPDLKNQIDKISELLVINPNVVAKNKKTLSEAFDPTTLNDATNAIKSLTSALKDLDEGRGISSESTQYLLENYPELLVYLNDENTLRQKLGETLDKLKQKQADLILNTKTADGSLLKDKLAVSEDFFNEFIKANDATWQILNEAYGSDLDNFKTLADAKLKINEFLVSTIADSWEQIYKSPEAALQQLIYAYENPDAITVNPFGSITEEQYNQAKSKLAALQSISDAMTSFATTTSTSLNNFGSSSSSSTGLPALDKALSNLPKYSEAIADLKTELDGLNKAIDDTTTALSNAEAAEDIPAQIELNKQLIEQYKQRQQKAHELAEAIRAEKAQIESDFRSEFSYFTAGKDVFNLSSTDVSSYKEQLQNKITEIDNQLNDLENDDPARLAMESDKQYYEQLITDLDNYTKAINDAKAAEAEMGKQWNADQQQIIKDQRTINELVQRQFDNSVSTVDNDLSMSQAKISALREGSAGWNQEIQNQILLLQQKQDLYKTEIYYLQEQAKIRKLSTDEQSKLNSLLVESVRIDADIVGLQKQKADAEYNMQQSIVGKMVELQRKAYEAEMKAEDERHNNVIDNLNEEKQQFEDFIDEKLKLLDEATAKEDYDRDLRQQDQAIAQKQAELNAVSKDTSDEGLARQAQLSQELQDLQQKKADAVRKHTVDEEKKMYQDLKDAKSKEIDDKIEAENSAYDSFKSNMDKMMEDSTMFSNAEAELANSTVEQIKSKYGELFNAFEAGIASNKKSWGEFVQQLQDFKTGNIPVPGGAPNGKADVSSATIDGIIQAKMQYPYASDQTQRDALHQRAVELTNMLPADIAQQIGDGSTTEGLTLPQLIELKKKLAGQGRLYAKGGVVDYTGIAWLDGSPSKPEYVLNNETFSKLLDSINIMKNFIPKFNLPNLPSFGGKTLSIGSITNHVYATPNQSPDEVADAVYGKFVNRIGKDLALQGL